MKLFSIKTWLSHTISIVLMLMALPIIAAEPKVGEEFTQTAQIIPTETPGKIEVVEIFWYGCPHCYHMDPILNEWVKKLPADVAFRRVPGLPQASWEPMAKAFYAMEDLNIADKYHSALFEAIHGANGFKEIAVNEKAAIAWMAKISGLDVPKVEAAFNSFSMKTKLARASQYFRASGATGVPSLVIDGYFITSSTMAGNNEAALKVADYIISNIRADKAAKSAKK